MTTDTETLYRIHWHCDNAGVARVDDKGQPLTADKRVKLLVSRIGEMQLRALAGVIKDFAPVRTL